jgi:nucleosome binding factor SPN SPT16 subunit
LKKQFELEERIVGDNWQDNSSKITIIMQDLQSYKPFEPFPSLVSKGRFFIDTSAQTILLPYRGTHIPFHILTIKHAQIVKVGSESVLKLHFWSTETSVNSR